MRSVLWIKAHICNAYCDKREADEAIYQLQEMPVGNAANLHCQPYLDNDPLCNDELRIYFLTGEHKQVKNKRKNAYGAKQEYARNQVAVEW